MIQDIESVQNHNAGKVELFVLSASAPARGVEDRFWRPVLLAFVRRAVEVILSCHRGGI
jgi:hypothetical protein